MHSYLVCLLHLFAVVTNLRRTSLALPCCSIYRVVGVFEALVVSTCMVVNGKNCSSEKTHLNRCVWSLDVETYPPPPPHSAEEGQRNSQLKGGSGNSQALDEPQSRSFKFRKKNSVLMFLCLDQNILISSIEMFVSLVC